MKKQLPERFRDIRPTILEIEDANRLVNEVLEYAESGDYDALQISETLVELLSRLSDKYTGFTPEASKRAFTWLKSCFDLNDYKLVDANLTVLVNSASLEDARTFVKSKITDAPDKETLDLLVDFCRELDESIKS